MDKAYEKYLCADRIDAYVIGLLSFAMRENHDIKSNIPISDELLYNLREILIPSLTKNSKRLHSIKIEAPMTEVIQSGEAIGTGLSCGVDSFYSIISHTSSDYKNLNVTHLCINNVGAFNECYSEYGSEKVKEERYAKTIKVAQELGLPLIETDSNFASEIYQNHYFTHTYSSIFAVYMLQKLWKIYYYGSSGLDFSTFSLKDNDIHDAAQYELLSLQCFSTTGIKIYSDGGEKTRLEKTKKIIHNPVVQNNLHVCTSKPFNCGICSKCRRTLLTLDALHCLEEFRNSFDIDKYKREIKKYHIWLYVQHIKKDEMNEPVYQIYKKKKEFKRSLRFVKYIAWTERIIPKNVKAFIRKIIKI